MRLISAVSSRLIRDGWSGVGLLKLPTLTITGVTLTPFNRRCLRKEFIQAPPRLLARGK